MVEYVYHVDEEDNVIGKVTKAEARKKHLLFRGSNTLIFNSKGDIYIQKRANDRDLYPNTWEFCIGGASFYGETYEETAKRELLEETGIRTESIEFLFNHNYSSHINKATVKIFRIIHDGPIQLNEESQEYRFVSMHELDMMMNKSMFNPEDTEVYERYKAMIK